MWRKLMSHFLEHNYISETCKSKIILNHLKTINMSKQTAQITILNNAMYPLVEIAVKHWQKDGEYATPSVFSSQYVKGENLKLSFKVDYDDKYENYWSVAFRNMHDTALQYLVTDPNYWQKFAANAAKQIDDAIGDAIDVCTESPVGTAFAVAANQAVDAIYSTAGGSAIIKNNIDSDTNVLTITFNCNRQSFDFASDKHKTKCSSNCYYPNNYCAEGKQ
jgi:hypothetical protein